MSQDSWIEAFKPDSEKTKELQANFVENCEKAADALLQADVLVLVTGAGFSADSGLATYTDVANIEAYQERGLGYSDICQPRWLGSDPELFYGFWGQCFNDYRKTKPHQGYDIIAHWRDFTNRREGVSIADSIRERVKRKEESTKAFDDDEEEEEDLPPRAPYTIVDGPAGAFYSFTSNVDAHFFDHFEAHEIYECHGNIELWQCSNMESCSSGTSWRAPLDLRFDIDPDTMLAPQTKHEFVGEESKQAASDEKGETEVPRIGHTTGLLRRSPLRYMPASNDKSGWLLKEGYNWPSCGHCGCPARPAILMFGDFSWKHDISQYRRWQLWRESVLDLCHERREKERLNVCILEIGCGLNVATCRVMSETMVSEIQDKGGEATLIRINRDFPLATDEDVAASLIPIMSTGLKALRQIDAVCAART